MAQAPGLLAGMSYPHRIQWQSLHVAGYRHIVCLTDQRPCLRSRAAHSALCRPPSGYWPAGSTLADPSPMRNDVSAMPSPSSYRVSSPVKGWLFTAPAGQAAPARS